MTVDLGWESERVLSMNVSPKMPSDLRRPWYRYVQWSDELIARLEATPGIEAAAVSTQVPLTASFSATLARGRGKESTDLSRWPAVQHNVSDGYFRLMGIRLLGGRGFEAADRLTEAQLIGEQPPERGVAVVSESTARALWPDRPAIGQILWLPDADRAAWREVVGVVEDIQFHAIGERPALHVFVPWTQSPTQRPRLLVKATGDVAAIAPVVRSVAQQMSIGRTSTRSRRSTRSWRARPRNRASPAGWWQPSASWRWSWPESASTERCRSWSARGGARSASAWRSALHASECSGRSSGAALRRRQSGRSSAASRQWRWPGPSVRCSST